MTGTVLELSNVISADLLATRLTERYIEWDTLRRPAKVDWEEVHRYVYQTDTTQTTNNQLPWKNKTTIPKLCQIRDNLFANYMVNMFPQRKWLVWEADEKDAASVAKRDAIVNYMSWVISQPSFKHEMEKLIMDYIDWGNCFATIEWIDQRVELDTKTQAGYVGPAIRRINPLDIVFNPTSENFLRSPKIVRSIISLGELKELLTRMSVDENREEYEALYNYLKEIRFHARTFQGDWQERDRLYQMDGFTSFRAYLLQDFVEVLTFYGDWHDYINMDFQKNRVITVVDRHKLIGNKPNPSYFGYPPIFHVPWRKRQDNLWGQGPLANLVGMQYRIDHVENMKADIFDLTTYPVQKIKGFVEDFTWQPGEKIFTTEEGDVELLQPKVDALHANMEIQYLTTMMEEMAGSPKEAMGFRTPGEKTKYEVQRLENASSRIYQNKTKQFEEYESEPLMNGLLELARRNMVGATTIKVLDEFGLATFQTITVEDITGVGRIKPIGARHFAEQAEFVQNMTNLAGSNLWPVVQPHVSGIRTAKALEDVFNIKDYEIFSPYVAFAEQADAQKRMNALQEGVHDAAGTATGINGDFDMDALQSKPQPAFGLKRAPGANAEQAGILATT